MKLENNPFFILSATPHDGVGLLMSLAEGNSLVGDAAACRKALSILTNSRQRLAAELTWFPGVAPDKITELLALLGRYPARAYQERSLPPLARANLLAMALTRLTADSLSAVSVASWMLTIDKVVNEIDARDAFAAVNTDRNIAEFPQVEDLTLVEEELASCREGYRAAISEVLSSMPPREAVHAVTKAIEARTRAGELALSGMMADVLVLYETGRTADLQSGEQEIDELAALTIVEARKNPDVAPEAMQRLQETARRWGELARPIQLADKSRGIEHAASLRVWETLRGLALALHSDCQRTDSARELISLARDIFEDITSVVAAAAEDADQLRNVTKARVTPEKQALQQQKHPHFEHTCNLTGKTFRLDADAFEYDGRRYPTAAITRLRWGSVSPKHGADARVKEATAACFFAFGTGNELETVPLAQEEDIYATVVERLWTIAGVRLLEHFLNAMAWGYAYRYGTVSISDKGLDIELPAREGTQHVFCPWSDTETVYGQDKLTILCAVDGKKYSAELYCQDCDVIHYLEAGLNLMRHTGASCLSAARTKKDGE